jgi:hypothetical protein
VWPDLRDQIEVEEAQLQRLLEVHKPLLEKCRTQSPDPIELSALSALLHSFYTGVENLFRRIAIEVDGRIVTGESWHRRLLLQMAEETERRPAVISSGLLERLRPYLQFRHVFRNSYSFQLQWDKMEPLVLDYEGTFALLRAEIAGFVARIS